MAAIAKEHMLINNKLVQFIRNSKKFKFLITCNRVAYSVERFSGQNLVGGLQLAGNLISNQQEMNSNKLNKK